MNCVSCGTEAICKTVDYLCNNKIIGDVVVPQVDVEECPNCGKQMLSSAAEIAVSHFLEILEREAIENLPANNLVSPGQAAKILGITKQAFSKNPKIKRGFVYFILIGTKKFFFRSSLELYKTTGDGRFPITLWKSSVDSGHVAICGTADGRWQQVNSSIEKKDGAVNIWRTSVQMIR